MRIIDKNQDYYDYLQDPTDNVTVFDRRNSFLLTKDDICSYFSPRWSHEAKSNYKFITLQCGGTFWLLLATITKREDKPYGSAIWQDQVVEYEFNVLHKWGKYDAPNKLLVVTHIGEMAFPFYYKMVDRKNDCVDYNKIMENKDNIVNAIIHNDIDERDVRVISTKEYSTDWHNKMTGRKCDIPLLKACGIANAIDAQELFCAIEEYFSIEKTKAERTEAIGTTNDDKIVMHGFDTNTSFRGKNK